MWLLFIQYLKRSFRSYFLGSRYWRISFLPFISVLILINLALVATIVILRIIYQIIINIGKGKETDEI